MVDRPFPKQMSQEMSQEMSPTSWERVYRRQVMRADLVPAWFEALALGPGDVVADLGCGPGYVSLRAAEVVGPKGRVYAVDRAAEALAYLERLQAEQGVSWITRLTADVAEVDPAAVPAAKALLTMMLHHNTDAPKLLRNLARLLPSGGVALIAEFHPEAACTIGPPREHRVSPDQLAAWAREAGLSLTGYTRQTDEHYMLTVTKGGELCLQEVVGGGPGIRQGQDDGQPRHDVCGQSHHRHLVAEDGLADQGQHQGPGRIPEDAG